MCVSASVSIALVRSKSGLLDLEKLDVKDEQATGATSAGVVAVGELGGDPEAALFAYDHELKAFGPAFDDPVERESCFLFPLEGAIEQFSVGGPAGVMHGDAIGGSGFLFAGAFFEDLGFEAGSGFFGIGGSGGDVGGSLEWVIFVLAAAEKSGAKKGEADGEDGRDDFHNGRSLGKWFSVGRS